MRVEHWANALHQGPAAARSMLGAGDAYDRLPYFFSDQYDVGMEYSGLRAAPGTASSSAATPRAASSSRSGSRGDRVVAGMNVNVWDVTDTDPGADPRARRRSTTGASPIPTSRSRSSPRRRGARHEPPAAAARRGRLDLARHALARAAGQRRLRRADRRQRGHRRDLQPDDLRQGDHRLGPLRRPAPRRRRVRRARRRRSCSSSSRSTTSAVPPTCCARPTTRSDGRDGFVSFECTPDLADDTAATIEQALELWSRLARPNVMIKVPATAAGIPAIEELTAAASTSTSRCCSPSSATSRSSTPTSPASSGASPPGSRSTRSPRSRRSSSRASTPRPTPCCPPTRRCAGAWRSPTPSAPTAAIASASPTSAGARCATPAPAPSDRCGPAPGRRTPPTPTCSTSRS